MAAPIIYGIRHHGPGSAKRLLAALTAQKPDCILIEGAPDADDLIQYAAYDTLKPPVAFLVYNPKNLEQAAFYPFAEFSPEWIALQFAIKTQTNVAFMDCPKSIDFALKTAEQASDQISIIEDTQTTTTEDAYEKDPLGYIAQLAGFSDSERWWETTFEQQTDSILVFETIIELMTALREALKRPETPETLLREAYMRTIIRENTKKGFKNIAVVCGAWHAPVLHNLSNFKPTDDAAKLKGLKKVATKATWIPWSYERLAMQSGYRAGVISPAWYELLFTEDKDASAKWMTQAARLMRKEGFNASSAEIIDGVRLATTLAAMREMPVAGLAELHEAAVSVFASGVETKMHFIKDKLMVGDKIGTIPKEVPIVPLQQDFEECVSEARLKDSYTTTNIIEKEFDLRKPTQLYASQLLHRLNILGIRWGAQKKVAGKKGSFHEHWQLKWQPELAIQLIEAGALGNTVLDATTKKTLQRIKESNDLVELTELTENILNADITQPMSALIRKLQQLSAVSTDILLLMRAVSPLVNVIRYGSIRKFDTKNIEKLTDGMVQRITIGLPNICVGINEEEAAKVFACILQLNYAISILNEATLSDIWLKALTEISNNEASNSTLSGITTRLLFDKGKLIGEEAATKMHYALSATDEAMKGVQWLEGFLHGSGLFLVHNPTFWKILDGWVDSISMEHFMEIVPLLRRTFSRFSLPERQKMFELAQHQQLLVPITIESEENEARATMVLEATRVLLGL